MGPGRRREVSLHHVELWVPDLAGAVRPWGWLFGELGWQPHQEWANGRSWRHGAQSYAAYLEDAWGYEVELAAGPP
jgi:catechol 2,3-dioxygenase-like lactoylglutathione lyase family enzyme